MGSTGFKNELRKGRQKQFKDVILKKNYIVRKQKEKLKYHTSTQHCKQANFTNKETVFMLSWHRQPLMLN